MFLPNDPLLLHNGMMSLCTMYQGRLRQIFRICTAVPACVPFFLVAVDVVTPVLETISLLRKYSFNG